MTITRLERGRWTPRAKSYCRSLEERFDLNPSDELILVEVCRGISRLDAIQDELAAIGTLTTLDRWDQLVTHPLVTEARLLSQAVAKLTGALRVPEIETDERTGHKTEKAGTRRPRRVQTRKMYAPGLTVLAGGNSP